MVFRVLVFGLSFCFFFPYRKRRRGLICRFLELYFPLEHLLHTYFGSKEKEEEQKQPKNIIEGLVVVVLLLLLLTRRALRLLFFGVSGYRRN